MKQLTEGDCVRGKINELPHLTKIHCSTKNMKRLMAILGYVDEVLFEVRYGRITHLLKIPIQISAVKALMHFWDPNYQFFTFGNIDMTPTIEEYAQILSFPHNPRKVYFRQKIENIVQEVAKLLCLDQVDQYLTSCGDFKWKAIENKLKASKDKGRLGEEGCPLVAFAIIGLVLFPSEAVGIISMEVASVFVEYEQGKNNLIAAILAETFLSLNHCRLRGKGTMQCCIPLLFMWIVSHLETPREVFNNFWWFNMRPLDLVLSEEWKDLDEKTWVEKYRALPLIGPTGYISYCPFLVTRQFGETQYLSRTKGLIGCMGSFREVNLVDELEVIKSDWRQPVLVGREPHPKESSVSPNYLAWRSYEAPQNAVRQSLMRDKTLEVARTKGKKIDKEDVQEDLEKLRIEFNNSKSHQKFLEEQLLEEGQMRVSLDQQLQGKEEQINRLMQRKSQLEEMDSRYNDLASKYEAIEKELVALKKASKSREHECQEVVASLKKEKDHYKMKWETKKEKGRRRKRVENPVQNADEK